MLTLNGRLDLLLNPLAIEIDDKPKSLLIDLLPQQEIAS